MHVNVFYFLIINHFGKHDLIGLRLGWNGPLEPLLKVCVTTTSSILLDSIENPERLIRRQKGTFRDTIRRLGPGQIVGMLEMRTL